MKTCKNCGKEVVYEETPIEDFWYHPHNGLMWCFENPWKTGKPISETPAAEVEENAS